MFNTPKEKQEEVDVVTLETWTGLINGGLDKQRDHITKQKKQMVQ